jgi:hypothetical protein
MEKVELRKQILDFVSGEYKKSGEVPSISTIIRHAKINRKKLYSLFPNGIAEICQAINIPVPKERISATKKAVELRGKLTKEPKEGLLKIELTGKQQQEINAIAFEENLDPSIAIDKIIANYRNFKKRGIGLKDYENLNKVVEELIKRGCKTEDLSFLLQELVEAYTKVDVSLALLAKALTALKEIKEKKNVEIREILLEFVSKYQSLKEFEKELKEKKNEFETFDSEISKRKERIEELDLEIQKLESKKEQVMKKMVEEASKVYNSTIEEHKRELDKINEEIENKKMIRDKLNQEIEEFCKVAERKIKEIEDLEEKREKISEDVKQQLEAFNRNYQIILFISAIGKFLRKEKIAEIEVDALQKTLKDLKENQSELINDIKFYGPTSPDYQKARGWIQMFLSSYLDFEFNWSAQIKQMEEQYQKIIEEIKVKDREEIEKLKNEILSLKVTINEQRKLIEKFKPYYEIAKGTFKEIDYDTLNQIKDEMEKVIRERRPEELALKALNIFSTLMQKRLGAISTQA